MEVAINKIVSVTYKLRLNGRDNEVIETVTEKNPLTFLFGSGFLLPGFESNLEGLKAGDSFDFSLSSEEAYGNFDPSSIIDIPLSSFQVDGKVDYELVKVGNSVPMQDSEGNKLTGVVKNIDDNAVSMDFNHPLAGNSLFFTGEITEVRQATEEELHHGHVHHENDCNDCSSCGDSCCS
jgi:FKBP-type peptidyl-prolyl cis-trans isomerase SlyD